MSSFLGKDKSVSEETWRIFRIMAEFVEGFETLSEIGPAVSIFGSARTPKTDKYYGIAQDLGRRFVEADYAVITGGGPGIMEAANRGAAPEQASVVPRASFRFPAWREFLKS